MPTSITIPSREPVRMDDVQRRVLRTLLSMQRQSWEQGVASQAALDLGEWDLAEAMARDSVTRQNAQGKLAEVDNAGIVNSGAVGEVVAWASTRDSSLRGAFDRQLGWLLRDAPRASDGTLFHIEGTQEMWVDSVYMVVPLLVLANEEQAALDQFHGHHERLFDSSSGLWGWRYDESSATLTHPEHWGTGNGWVAAGVARAIHLGLGDRDVRRHGRTVIDACLALRSSDGSFHNILDDDSTFEENTVGMMLAYALLCGVSDGWLPASYGAVGRSLTAQARRLVDANGFVQRVCGAPHFDHQGTSAEAQSFFLLATAAEKHLDA